MKNAATRLQQLETEIENGIRTVGRCLTEVRETKCYLGEYETFEQYCKIRWHFSDRHVRRLIDVERVKTKIGQICPVETLKDSHILEIAKIPEKQQAQVAAEILEQCEVEGRAPTAKDFKKAASSFVETKTPDIPAYDDSEYEDVEVEPKPDKKQDKPEPTIKEQVSSLRSVALQHYRAAMRAVDDLHRLKPDKDTVQIIAAANVTIQDAVERGFR